MEVPRRYPYIYSDSSGFVQGFWKHLPRRPNRYWSLKLKSEQKRAKENVQMPGKKGEAAVTLSKVTIPVGNGR
jgi:hypothetical protein